MDRKPVTLRVQVLTEVKQVYLLHRLAVGFISHPASNEGTLCATKMKCLKFLSHQSDMSAQVPT